MVKSWNLRLCKWWECYNEVIPAYCNLACIHAFILMWDPNTSIPKSLSNAHSPESEHANVSSVPLEEPSHDA